MRGANSALMVVTLAAAMFELALAAPPMSIPRASLARDT